MIRRIYEGGRKKFAAVVVFACLLPAAVAVPVFEQPAGTGSLPGSAQMFNPLIATAIIGNLLPVAGGNPENKVDLYGFTSATPFLFGAMTLGGPFAVDDPQLFLFDSLGRGLLFNGDRSWTPFDPQAELATALYTAGTYYLGISLFAVDPVDITDAPIFDTSTIGGPAQNNLPLAGWVDQSGLNLWDNTEYVIALNYQAIPEPATSMLSAVAGIAIVIMRVRRRA